MAPPKGWKVASSNALKQRDTPMVNKREKKEKAIIMRGLEDGLLWYIEGNGKEEDQLMLVILTLPYLRYLRVGLYEL